MLGGLFGIFDIFAPPKIKGISFSTLRKFEATFRVRKR